MKKTKAAPSLYLTGVFDHWWQPIGGVRRTDTKAQKCWWRVELLFILIWKDHGGYMSLRRSICPFFWYSRIWVARARYREWYQIYDRDMQRLRSLIAPSGVYNSTVENMVNTIVLLTSSLPQIREESCSWSSFVLNERDVSCSPGFLLLNRCHIR